MSKKVKKVTEKKIPKKGTKRVGLMGKGGPVKKTSKK